MSSPKGIIVIRFGQNFNRELSEALRSTYVSAQSMSNRQLGCVVTSLTLKVDKTMKDVKAVYAEHAPNDRVFFTDESTVAQN